jgi:hypothetical protein
MGVPARPPHPVLFRLAGVIRELPRLPRHPALAEKTLEHT